MTLLIDFTGLYGYAYVFVLEYKESFEIVVLDFE